MYPLCANCEIEIRWRPTVVNGSPYCCQGCSEGGPCICDYAHLSDMTQDEARPIRIIRFHLVQTL